MNQVALAFAMHPHLEKIIAIAAAGPYWTHKTFSLHHIPVQEWAHIAKFHDNLEQPTRFVERPWAKFVRLNTLPSDRWIARMQRKLQDMLAS